MVTVGRVWPRPKYRARPLNFIVRCQVSNGVLPDSVRSGLHAVVFLLGLALCASGMLAVYGAMEMAVLWLGLGLFAVGALLIAVARKLDPPFTDRLLEGLGKGKNGTGDTGKNSDQQGGHHGT